MTLNTLFWPGTQPADTVATPANTGFSAIIETHNADTINGYTRFKTDGLEFKSNGTLQQSGRQDTPANLLYSYRIRFCATALPTAPIHFFGPRQGATEPYGNGYCARFQYDSNVGNRIFFSNASNQASNPLWSGLTPGNFYELTATFTVDTATTGACVFALYEADGTTLIGPAVAEGVAVNLNGGAGTLTRSGNKLVGTGMNLGSTNLTAFDAGCNGGQLSGGATFKIAYISWNNGSTTEIAKYDSVTPLATPVLSGTGKTDPTTPGGTNGTITRSWAAISGATSYDAYISSLASPAQENFTLVAAGVTSPFTWTGLAAGVRTVGIKAKV